MEWVSAPAGQISTHLEMHTWRSGFAFQGWVSSPSCGPWALLGDGWGLGLGSCESGWHPN